MALRVPRARRDAYADSVDAVEELAIEVEVVEEEDGARARYYLFLLAMALTIAALSATQTNAVVFRAGRDRIGESGQGR